MRALDMTLSFLGIANSRGSTDKWSLSFDRIRLAEWEVANEVMEENRKHELDLTIAAADEKVLE